MIKVDVFKQNKRNFIFSNKILLSKRKLIFSWIRPTYKNFVKNKTHFQNLCFWGKYSFLPQELGWLLLELSERFFYLLQSILWWASWVITSLSLPVFLSCPLLHFLTWGQQEVPQEYQRVDINFLRTGRIAEDTFLLWERKLSSHKIWFICSFWMRNIEIKMDKYGLKT